MQLFCIASAAGALGQLFVSMKFALSAPVTEMSVISNGAVPIFASRAFCGALVVLGAWPLKFRIKGRKLDHRISATGQFFHSRHQDDQTCQEQRNQAPAISHLLLLDPPFGWEYSAKEPCLARLDET